MKRRQLLFSSSCIAALASLSLPTAFFLPLRVHAQWPTDAFFARKLNDAMAALTGNSPVRQSSSIEIHARSIAEDGSTVPVEIRSHLPNSRTITVLSEKNPNPAIARYRIGTSLEPWVSTRIKMAGTGDVIALVETEEGFFFVKKRIQVTAGGCG